MEHFFLFRMPFGQEDILFFKLKPLMTFANAISIELNGVVETEKAHRITPDFSSLVDQYQAPVYNTCLGFLRNEEDAEDMAQEVFIEAFRSMNKFRGDSQLSTWLYRIAVNKSLEHIRKINRHKRKGDTVSISAEMEVGGDRFYHPGIALENKERSSILFDAIDQLVEPQKVAFTLHKVEGLSYEEIARVMDKSVASIESLMHRAKTNLQKLLKVYYEAS